MHQLPIIPPNVAEDPLAMAVTVLQEAGIEFSVVCEGPDTTCAEVPAAA